MSILFAFGMGYTSKALANKLPKNKWQIYGTSQTDDGAARIQALGFNGKVFEKTNPDDVPDEAHWLISIPPNLNGCPVFKKFASRANSASSITYLSTTGVYGNLNGGWAFEWTNVNPLRQRSFNRVTAELQWRKTKSSSTIVRLPGIYGVGRNAFSKLRDGSAYRIDKPEQIFSRIYIDDLVTGLQSLLESQRFGGVVHFTDDKPAPQEEVIAYSASLLGLSIPPLQPFNEANLSPMAREFYSESKRVSNARAKAILGWKPQFASFHDGMSDILQKESGLD